VVKAEWTGNIEQTNTGDSEEFNFKGKNRISFFGTGAALIFGGLILILIVFLRFPYLPGLIIAAIMLLIVAPILGMIMVSAGIYRTGVFFMGIGAFTFFPVGLAEMKVFSKIWNFGTEVRFKIKNGEKTFRKDGVVIKTPTALMIGVIIISVVLIIAPVVSYAAIMNKPMLRISSYDVPSTYEVSQNVKVGVTLYNYGHQQAEADKIEVKISGSGSGTLQWKEKDIGMMESVTYSFSIPTSGRLDKIVLFYDGEKIDEMEIEGLWIPSYG
jgi:hypothetical protein